MKKQARDIAKTSNGKVVLVAADELKVTSSFYGSIFAEKEKINGKTEYSKIPISLLEVGGSKKNVTFYLDVDQAEYLYEFAKSFGDCSYSSCKKNEAQKLKRTLLVRLMNRIHRFIDCFVTAYSTNIMKMKFNNEQNWKQNKN